MSTFNYFGIKNFRVFDNSKGLSTNLAPITLITGANNSGKSSILKALLLLRDSIKNPKEGFDLDLKGKEHFLGDFENLLCDKTKNRLEFILPFPFIGIKDLVLSLVFKSEKNRSVYNPELKEICIYSKKTPAQKLMYFAYKNATQEEKDRENSTYHQDIENGFEHDFEHLIGYLEWSINYKEIKNHLAQILIIYEAYYLGLEERKEKSKTSFAPFSPNSILIDVLRKLDPGNSTYAYSDFIHMWNKKTDIQNWRLFLAELEEKSKEETIPIQITEEDFHPTPISPSFNEVFFGLVKSIINKHLTWFEKDDSPQNILLIYFDNLWARLFNRVKTITHTPSTRGIASRIYYLNTDNVFAKLIQEYSKYESDIPKDFIENWLKKFNIGNSLEVKYFPKYDVGQVFINISNSEKRPIVDFGYGIMQLITILIQIAVLAVKNINVYAGHEEYYSSVLLIEEPETNLHPNWQTLLAQLFVEANRRFNIQFLIETHSEYMIRSFQNLVSNNLIYNENIQIIYLRNKKFKKADQGQVTQVNINNDGSIPFKEFDSGFFNENTNLELSLLNIQRNSFIDNYKQLKEDFEKNKKDAVEAQKALQEKIDSFIEKQDISTYTSQVNICLGSDQYKMLNPCQNYLASAKFLFSIFGSAHNDYSPIAIQCGRIVEAELLDFFTQCKAICPNGVYLTTPPLSSTNWNFSINSIPVGLSKNGNPSLKWHSSIQFNRIGNLAMWDCLALLYCYPNIVLHPGLSNNGYLIVDQQLNIHFNDSAKIIEEDFLEHIKFLIDKRDESAHTFSSSLIDFSTAQKLMLYIEEFIQKWILNKV